MDAAVTLKLTPAEFDLIREAVRTAKVAALKENGDRAAEPQARRDAAARAAQLGSLHDKLR